MMPLLMIAFCLVVGALFGHALFGLAIGLGFVIVANLSR